MSLEEDINDPSLTRDKLFSLYTAAVRERYPNAKVEFSPPDKLDISTLEGWTFRAYMENLWIECREQERGNRIKGLERYLRALDSTMTGNSGPVVTIEDIVPMIKDQEYLSLFGDGPSPVRELLAGDIWIVYAINLPTSIRTLSPTELTELRLDIDSVRSRAIENLERLMPEVEQHGTGPWYMLTAGGDFVASILLLDGVWAQLESSVDGDVVAAVPSRDVLLYTGSRSGEGIAYIRRKACEIREAGHHVISQTLLRRTSGRWGVLA